MRQPIPFPLRGLHDGLAAAEQPPLTTREALNVRGLDPVSGRLRGAQRSGTVRYSPEPLSDATEGAGPRVRSLQSLTHDNARATVEVLDGTAGLEPEIEWSRANPAAWTSRRVAIDRAGNCWALSGTRQLVQLSPDGERLRTIDLPAPAGAEVLPLLVDRYDRVYAGVWGAAAGVAGAVWMYAQDAEGVYRRVWTLDLGESARAVALALDAEDRLQAIVSDPFALWSELRIYGDVDSASPRLIADRRVPHPARCLAVNSRGETHVGCLAYAGRAVVPGDTWCGEKTVGDTPVDFADAPAVWAEYDASTIAGVVDGAPISLVQDRADGGRSLVWDADGGYGDGAYAGKPAFIRSALCELPGIRFAAGTGLRSGYSTLDDQWANRSCFPSSERGGAWTAFLLIRIRDTVSPFLIARHAGHAGWELWANYDKAADLPAPGKIAWFFTEGTAGGAQLDPIAYDEPSGLALIRLTLNGGGATFTSMSVNGTDPPVSPLEVDSIKSSDPAYFGGYGPFDLMHLLVYSWSAQPPDYTTAFWAETEGWMAHKWGVQSILVDGHPHQSAAPGLDPQPAPEPEPDVLRDPRPLHLKFAPLAGELVAGFAGAGVGRACALAPDAADTDDVWTVGDPVNGNPGTIGSGDEQIHPLAPFTPRTKIRLWRTDPNVASPPAPGFPDSVLVSAYEYDTGEWDGVDPDAIPGLAFSEEDSDLDDPEDAVIAWKGVVTASIPLCGLGTTYDPAVEHTPTLIVRYHTDGQYWTVEKDPEGDPATAFGVSDFGEHITGPGGGTHTYEQLHRWQRRDGEGVCLAQVEIGFEGRSITIGIEPITPPPEVGEDPDEEPVTPDPTTVRRLHDAGEAFSTAASDGAWARVEDLGGEVAPQIAVDAEGNLYRPRSESGGASLCKHAPTGGEEWTLIAPEGAGAGTEARGSAVVLAPGSAEDLSTDPDADAPEPEYAYLGTDAGNGRLAVHKIRLVRVTREDGNPRSTKLVCVAGPDVAVVEPGGEARTPEGGAGALTNDRVWADAAVLFGKVYFTDGERYRVYDPKRDRVEPWVATTGGAIPPRCQLIAAWRGRIVLARAPGDPHNWHMSALGDPGNWDQFPPVVTIDQAVSGNDPRVGPCPDIINALLPVSDDLILFGGDRSVLRLTGDPMAGAVFDVVTEETGMAFGRSACVGPDFTAFWFGSRGGVWAMPPGGPARPITTGAIHQRMSDVSLADYTARLVWSDVDDGLHVFLVPMRADAAAPARHWFWERRAGGMGAWWEDSYPVVPTAACVVDGDDPEDRAVVVGGVDGCVRAFDPAAVDDDPPAGESTPEAIDARVLLGPFGAGPEGAGAERVRVSRLHAVLAEGQHGVGYELLAGDNPEDVPAIPAASGTFAAGRNVAGARARGQAWWLRLSNATAGERFAVELLAAEVERAGRTR